MREKIPKSIEQKVLVKNRHACCICGPELMHKPVEIHHIDGKNSNNKIDNLAVLCFDHHSMADAGLQKGKYGAGKKLTPVEVKDYKRRWEARMDATNKIQKRSFPLYQKKHLEILHRYEINKIKNEILAFDDKDKRLKEKFAYLEQLVMEDIMTNLPLRKFLLDAYEELVVPGWIIEDVNKSKLLTTSVLNLFPHLADPSLVPIDHYDKKLILSSVEVLEKLASFSGEFSSVITPLKSACNALYQIAEIASLYNLKSVKRKILNVLKAAMKDCSDYKSERNDKKFVKQREERIEIVRQAIAKVKKFR